MKGTTDIFKNYFIPGINKLALIYELLSEDKNETPEALQGLQQSLKSSGEKGLCEILEEILGHVDKFCLMMDCMHVKIRREEVNNDN